MQPQPEETEQSRNAKIISLVRKGKSFRVTAKKFKISTSRVGQIVKKEIAQQERWHRDKRARALFKEFHNARILQNLQVVTHALTNIIEPYATRIGDGDGE